MVASDILSDAGSESGYDVKKSDILGLAVRGGSVVSHVRWAEKVHAPMIEEGGAGHLVFGTHLPLSYAGPALVKRAILPVDEETLADVSHRRAGRILGIEFDALGYIAR